MYLTGSKSSKLDSKARLTVPAEWRRQLGDFVCLVPIRGALHGFTPEGHKLFVESLFPDGYNPRDLNQVKLRSAITSSTTTVEIDSAGRVCLGKVPASTRDQLGIGSDVTINGNDDHFEVWDSTKWAAEQQGIDLDALMFGDAR
jgi:MraZ protein